MFRSFPLCYETNGESSNPCVLFIAGIGGQLVNWPQELIQGLVDKGFYVVTFDNRDAGLSKHYDEFGQPNLNDLLQGKMPEKFYTLDDMAADAVLLLDKLHINKAHIVGMSMGGMIAQLVAINYPDRVESLTCIATSSGEKGLPEARPEVQKFFFAPKRDKQGTKEEFIKEKTALYKVYNHPEYFDEEESRRLHERIYERNHDSSGFMRQLIAMAIAASRTERLGKLDVPALVIHGDYDPAFPLEHGKQLADAIHGSQLVVLEKFGHGLPTYFCRILVDKMSDFYVNAASAKNKNKF